LVLSYAIRFLEGNLVVQKYRKNSEINPPIRMIDK
jgi:hypothetical protein